MIFAEKINRDTKEVSYHETLRRWEKWLLHDICMSGKNPDLKRHTVKDLMAQLRYRGMQAQSVVGELWGTRTAGACFRRKRRRPWYGIAHRRDYADDKTTITSLLWEIQIRRASCGMKCIHLNSMSEGMVEELIYNGNTKDLFGHRLDAYWAALRCRRF